MGRVYRDDQNLTPARQLSTTAPKISTAIAIS